MWEHQAVGAWNQKNGINMLVVPHQGHHFARTNVWCGSNRCLATQRGSLKLEMVFLPWVSSGPYLYPDVRETHQTQMHIQTKTTPTAAAVNTPVIPGICKEMLYCSGRVQSMATFHFPSPKTQQHFKSLTGKMCINHSLACNG